MELTFKLYYWPILTTVWFGVTFISAYLISTLNGHVYPLFPYISDTGTTVPESCWFGQLLNIGALFMGVTMYIRYKQINLAITSEFVDIDKKWNTVSKCFGFIACLGMSIVANFQELAIPFMHFIGAVGAFGFGSIYFILQTRVTSNFRSARIQNSEYGISNTLYYTRIFLSATFLPLFLINMITSFISMSLFDGKTIIWWSHENKGYALHLVAVIAEWILAILMMVYVLTFIREFKQIEFEEIKIKYKN